MLNLTNITLCLSNVSNTSALSYAGGVNIGFTFNPTISLSVSDDLTISNLTPGSSLDSNIITVGVATNAAYGYTLTSTVGNEDNNTTRNLVNTADNAKTFTSIDFGASLPGLTTDNTWGYSYSSDNGTIWANYSGLPLYNDQANVATLLSSKNPTTNGSVQFKIAAKASTTQASGTYANVVNFYAVAKIEPPYLYDEVQKQSKGTLAANNVNLSDGITKTNSGVYEYDSSVYGVSSDANNNKKIYFYRGILDEVTGTYGSDGDGEAYPNYAVLSATGTKATTDTCWRIVRTTGSGGVKMIYNGTWTGTTCANATTAAQIRSTAKITAGDTSTFTLAYNGSSSINRRIALVGYTYNPTYGDNDVIISTSVDLVFGSSSNYSGNTSDSKIKGNIETWYNNNLSGYTSILETSAGYCNDRSSYSDTTTNSALQDIVPYATSDVAMYFGAYGRNMNAANAEKKPSLTCPRGIVDIYSVNGDSTGNEQLSRPIALLTADEASFVGSGRSTGSQGSSYNANSYLRSGGGFWLLSPNARISDGHVTEFYQYLYGYSHATYISDSFGVRPVISLKLGTEYSDGTGTATDPWIIPAP